MKKSMEIERKFLVDKTKLPELNLNTGKKIKQVYLMDSEQMTLRLRLLDDQGFMTVKSGLNGFSRKEIETNVSPDFVDTIILEYKLKVLEKTRYDLFENNNHWELDVFNGKYEGLIIAEIELESESQKLILPKWVGEEITLKPEYYNNSLYENL